MYAGLELAFLLICCSCLMALRLKLFKAFLLMGLTFLGDVFIECSKLEGMLCLEPCCELLPSFDIDSLSLEAIVDVDDLADATE